MLEHLRHEQYELKSSKMDVEQSIAKINKVDDAPRLLDPPRTHRSNSEQHKSPKSITHPGCTGERLVVPDCGESLVIGIHADEQNAILAMTSKNAVLLLLLYQY